MSILLSILSLVIGLFLTVVPWTWLWEANTLISPHSPARALVMSGFARGSVTGVGLINILLALYEAGLRFGDRD